MGEIENFMEREDKIKKYCFAIGIVATIFVVISALLHDNTGKLIYLFSMISFCISAMGFYIIGYLIQVQNKIMGVLGFILQGGQEDQQDIDAIVDKLVPQFVKMVKKELKK